MMSSATGEPPGALARDQFLSSYWLRLAVLIPAFVLGYVLMALNAPTASAVACADANRYGTSGEDYVLLPSNEATDYYAYGSSDYVETRDCDDYVEAGGGPDQIHGAYGQDWIVGGDGHDRLAYCNNASTWCGTLYGGAHDDTLWGGAGGDRLDDAAAAGDTDALWGQGSDDILITEDGDNSDALVGGAGTDACYRGSDLDGYDSTCEGVY